MAADDNLLILFLIICNINSYVQVYYNDSYLITSFASHYGY